MATHLKRPRLSRRWRLSLVVVHIMSAAAWIGVDVIMAVLVAVGQLSDHVETQSLAYRALATFVVWPMLVSSLVCLASGIALGLGTKWGLVRYWWVAAKLVLNLALCTLIWFALRPGMPAIGAYGEDLLLGAADPIAIASLGMPPTVSLTALTLAVLLSVFKPWGRIATRTASRNRLAESGRPPPTRCE